MQIITRIRQLGFRRWYERTLIEAHAHLITCFFGMILAFAGIEMVGNRSGLAQGLFGIGIGAAGVGLTAYGWLRYFKMIAVAEQLGAHATCPACGTYAYFTTLAGGPEEQESTVDPPESTTLWLRVQCRECGHTWLL